MIFFWKEKDIEKCIHIHTHTQTLKVFKSIYTKLRRELEVKGRYFPFISLCALYPYMCCFSQ